MDKWKLTLKRIRDRNGWTALLEFISRLPSSQKADPFTREQRALALAKTGEIRRAVGVLQRVIAQSGPTPQRLGLLGGRYKELFNEAQTPAQRRKWLNRCIRAYAMGAKLGGEDYYCISNLARLYRARGGAGDAKRARAAAKVTLSICQMARRSGRGDSFWKLTLLGAAFDSADVSRARKLAQNVKRERVEAWKLESTLRDLYLSLLHVEDPAARDKLRKVAEGLEALLPPSETTFHYDFQYMAFARRSRGGANRGGTGNYSVARTASTVGPPGSGRSAEPRTRAGGFRPPRVPWHSLDLWEDVPVYLGARDLHDQNLSGKGVRVAFLDTGFDFSHPFFKSHRLRGRVRAAPGARDPGVDRIGHGTMCAAHLLAVAPGATCLGIKVARGSRPAGNPELDAFVTAFETALRESPDIIVFSMGIDMRFRAKSAKRAVQTDGIKPIHAGLERLVEEALRRNILVVSSAGNGEMNFPAMMNGLVAVGGVYQSRLGHRRVSNYSSAFTARAYGGRTVPDICGLVGMREQTGLPKKKHFAPYVWSPVPPGSIIDRMAARKDRSKEDDGWALLSGTSVAAPQVAGVAALLLEAWRREPSQGLSIPPGLWKRLLAQGALPVRAGRANPDCNPGGTGMPADKGGAGAGLANAAGSLKLLLQYAR